MIPLRAALLLTSATKVVDSVSLPPVEIALPGIANFSAGSGDRIAVIYLCKCQTAGLIRTIPHIQRYMNSTADSSLVLPR